MRPRRPARALSCALAPCLVVLLATGCARHAPGPPSPPPAAPPATPPPLEPTEVIQLTSLTAGDLVTSPLVIQGQARGRWFFEGRFPVTLVDEAGRELAHAGAHAEGDWTREGFVPFTVTLFFTVPRGVTAGAVVFRNDNPSGIPEQQREKRVLVRFLPAGTR